MWDRGGKAIGLIAFVQLYIGFHFVLVFYQMVGVFEYLSCRIGMKMIDLTRAM